MRCERPGMACHKKCRSESGMLVLQLQAIDKINP